MEITRPDLERTYADKANEELLLLHGRGTLTDAAYEALEAELASRNIPVPQRPQPDAELHASKAAFQRTTLLAHWSGYAPLASAYWLVGTLGFWTLYGALILIYKFAPAITPVAVSALLAFLVFAWVSIWRCWKNTGWFVWGYLARVNVVVFVIVTAVVLVTFFMGAGVFSGRQQGSLLE